MNEYQVVAVASTILACVLWWHMHRDQLRQMTRARRLTLAVSAAWLIGFLLLMEPLLSFAVRSSPFELGLVQLTNSVVAASLLTEILQIDHPSWIWLNRRHKRVIGAIAIVVFGTTFPVLLICRASLLGHGR